MKKILISLLILQIIPAFATDGVIEINHTCAINDGCFSGDTAGYPVTINANAGHSYRLTSNLVIPDNDTDGISISKPNISIDLNGFSIVTSGCENSQPTNCSLFNGGVHGYGVTSNENSITVKNGTVIGMGNDGIYLPNNFMVIENIMVLSNALNGIHVGNYSRVLSSKASYNGADGIKTGDGCIVSNNVSFSNELTGINTSNNSIIISNQLSQNKFALNSLNSSLIINNYLNGNNLSGITVLGLSIIKNNVSRYNKLKGISSMGKSLLVGNNVNNSSLDLKTNDVIYKNYLQTGDLNGSPYNMGENFCDNSLCQ
jgi:hypothetical protein